MNEGLLTEPGQTSGVLDFPEWDFMEIKNYVHPVLHGKIGWVSCTLDWFNDLLDNNIETQLEEEKTARNVSIIDIPRTETIECHKTFKQSESIGFMSW